MPDQLVNVAKAEVAARDVLACCYGVHVVQKAWNLGTADGFDAAVGSLAAKLASQAGSSELDAVRAAVGTLDVDWRKTDPEQRRRLINDALVAAGRKTALVPTKIEHTLEIGARDAVKAGREDLRRQKVTVGAKFNALDERIVAYLPKSQVLFVTDEYRRRNDAFGERARDIVTAGLERGLGRDDIAEELQKAAQGIIAGRSRPYWDVVAGAFVARGRSLAQISGYAEAGIEAYQIVAVLDEHTTEICRFLDGKVFQVDSAIKAFQDAEKLEDPNDVKKAQPWVRQIAPKDGAPGFLYVRKGPNPGDIVRIATIDKPGMGRRDAVGEYSRAADGKRLSALGVGFPPYHGLCRSTTVPAD